MYFMDFILNVSFFIIIIPLLLQLFLCEWGSFLFLSWNKREGAEKRNFIQWNTVKEIPADLGCYLQITTSLLVNGWQKSLSHDNAPAVQSLTAVKTDFQEVIAVIKYPQKIITAKVNRGEKY